MAIYIALELYFLKKSAAQESNKIREIKAEEKIIKNVYDISYSRIIKSKKITLSSDFSSNIINQQLLINKDSPLFIPSKSSYESAIQGEFTFNAYQQESEKYRLEAIQKNTEENRKLKSQIELENRIASELAKNELNKKQIARAKQIEIEHEEHLKHIEIDLLEKKKNELSFIRSQKEFGDASSAAILTTAEEHRKQIELNLYSLSLINDDIQASETEISNVKNIEVEKEKDNSSQINKVAVSNSLKLDKKKKFEFFYGKGSLNEVGIRFLSDTKNSVEIIYADSNAMLSNYNDIGSISGSIADNSVNLYVNLGYNYSFNSKKVKINYLREINENTYFKSGLSFSSVEHDLNVYGSVTSTYNNVSTTPVTYSNSNYIKLDFVSPYLGLEYQKEISQIGLFVYGNIGIEYSPPSTFDSVSSVIDGRFNSYSNISSDISAVKRNVAKYQEIKFYSVGIKYKF